MLLQDISKGHLFFSLCYYRTYQRGTVFLPMLFNSTNNNTAITKISKF